jgi:hypothetical protein
MARRANFFLRDGFRDWATQPLEVCDGGHAYFQVIYRPEEGDFARFWVNGEA